MSLKPDGTRSRTIPFVRLTATPQATALATRESPARRPVDERLALNAIVRVDVRRRADRTRRGRNAVFLAELPVVLAKQKLGAVTR
jgi:hypothetical protein